MIPYPQYKLCPLCMNNDYKQICVKCYINNPNIGERKKIRRDKNFLKKKGKDFIMDRRATGLISVLMVLGLPYYLTHTSLDPVYFGLYSLDFMIINIIYIFALLFFSFMFVYSTKKKLYYKIFCQ